MTIAATEQPEGRGLERFLDKDSFLVQALAVIAVGVVLWFVCVHHRGLVLGFLDRFPDSFLRTDSRCPVSL